MSGNIDWERLSRNVGVGAGEKISKNARSVARNDFDYARWALTELLGDAEVHTGVDCYIAGDPGCDLARNVLRFLLPYSAMSYCKYIFDHPEQFKIQERRSAVELLRDICDDRVLPWIVEFISDEDPEIQAWGALIIQNLINREEISRVKATPFIAIFEDHPNDKLYEIAMGVKVSLDDMEDI